METDSNKQKERIYYLLILNIYIYSIIIQIMT